MARATPSLAAARVCLLLALGLAAALLGSCGERDVRERSPRSVVEIEQLFQQVRALQDQLEVTRGRGATIATDGTPLPDLIEAYDARRLELQQALASDPQPPPEGDDVRALEVMRHSFELYLPEQHNAPEPTAAEEGGGAKSNCHYDAAAVEQEDGYESLSKRIYHCFSEAAHALEFEGEPLDRLTVFGRLPLTVDPAQREGLWRSMAPVWESVNGNNGLRSPYRTLIRLNAARMQREAEVLGASVRGIGVEPETMEGWLVAVLQKWHDITPDTAIEPWDFAYETGRASRALGGSIPLGSLRAVNDRFYHDLGADPLALQVHYDLEPRASKDPVAFTTFGRRPRLEDGRWQLGEPWVFASYRMGGLDNLLELLHETGHAVHIAAIRTRPAYTDWPDSDIFTEGIADIATLEMYEPAWQQRYLGASVSLQDAITAKYAAIVMDIAWALFEVRMHRAPERDPNEVWSEICEKYFRIRRHPELAWWAVRGQLIDSPGYMMNYAAGAILNADLRARARALYGPYTEGDPQWYGRISESLYRFGLERTSKQVIEDFLGRPVSEQALLDDMSRAVAGTN